MPQCQGRARSSNSRPGAVSQNRTKAEQQYPLAHVLAAALRDELSYLYVY